MSSNIRLYSTLTRTTEPFKPLKPQELKMYACGVTTYDDAHLGHARQAIFFDIVRNYFEYLGYTVNYVRNYTDIDDKIINRAAEQKRDPLELSDFFVKKTASDLAALKVRSATHEPKVTEHIPEIIAFIQSLIDQGIAYEADGEVLFGVTAFKKYGKLSRLKADELINSDVASYKKHPQDFSLWKKAKPGEQYWDSPWGQGRPGWHIECSVLARHYLGDQIDIHGGGIDLIFPHHENEIAQTESLTKEQFASYWLHNGLVMVQGKKMSKSLGNFITIEQALKRYQPDVIRFAILGVHFSSPLDFTDELFQIAEKRVVYFYRTLEEIHRKDKNTCSNNLKELADRMIATFEAAMNDNVNTVVVISELSTVFQELNKHLSDPDVDFSYFLEQFKKITTVFRLFDEDPAVFLAEAKERLLKAKNMTVQDVEQKIAERAEAKAKKDFAKSDAIRDELQKNGILLQDTEKGTSWTL